MSSRSFIFLVSSVLVFSCLVEERLASQRRSVETAPTITGRVVDESGQPPEQLMQVDLLCSGRIRRQTMTSPDGTFSFDLGSRDSEPWMDPRSGGSVNGAMEGPVRVAPAGSAVALDQVPSMGRGRMSMSNCEVQLSPEPGLVANSIPLGTRGSFDNPDIGTIVFRRLSDSAATMISLNTLNAPKNAQKALKKASDELASEKPNLDKALKELEKAIEEYPEFSAAWDLMARVQLSKGDIEKGRECFERAVKEEPKFIPPYMGLTQLAVQQADWPTAQTWAGKVLALDSSLPQALYWHGLANYYLSSFEEAEKKLALLYKMGHSERFPFGLLLIGVIHANQGKVPAAAAELRLYLELMPPAEVPAAQRKELERQLAEWEAAGLVTESADQTARP